ncbi:MAG: S-layer homology domain-containing protein [Pelotomaculum sp.]|nr:S-layer homology domain-containing protein [Pelotomaculum sp.]
MFRRKIMARVAVFLAAILVLAQPALAAGIPFTVEIDGDSTPGPTIITQKNTVSVRVYDPEGADHTVKVGSILAVKTGPGEYEVENYALKAGTNSLTVSADTYKDTYTLIYVDEALPGASYYLQAIPASGKITAINKTLTLKFPKNNYIAENPDAPRIVEDQGLRIEVVSFDYDECPTVYHQAVSPVYKITPESDDLDSDSERDEAAVLYPGELTLKYDANVSSAAADTLTVIYIPYGDGDYDEYDNDFQHFWDDDWSDRGCVVLGGRVDTAARTVTVPFGKTGFGTYAVFNVNREFYDLLDVNNNLSWARNYVLPVWAKGVMEKTGDGENFGNTPITREEFTAAIVKAMGIPVENDLQNPFEDVNSSSLAVDEYDDYILTAAKNGIIYGFPTTSGLEFRPGDYLTREQAATIIARVAGLKVSDNEAVTTVAMKRAFYDYSQNPDDFGPWAAPFIYAAYKAGFIQGSPVEVEGKTLYAFNPKGNLSRTEAAKLLYVLMKKQKRL